MDKATQSMIENLQKKTGKSLEEWTDIVNKEDFTKHGDIIQYLKDKHGLTYGFANFIAHKSKGSDAGSAENQDDLIAKQYKGKEHFKPMYDKLIAEISAFGDDIEISPKNAYVSLRRKKQFATLNPATKSRFEVGLNLKGQQPEGKLVPEKPNAMCSHKLNLEELSDIDQEIIEWIRKAYEKAG